MTPEQMREDIAEMNEEALFADGFDDALIGSVRQFNNTVALYDYQACIEVLMRDGLDYDDAVEYFEFNVVGAWVGPATPAFAHLMRKEASDSGLHDV